MDRRTMLQVSGIAVLGLLLGKSKAFGQVIPAIQTEQKVEGLIERNHGHIFETLTVSQLTLLLQEAGRNGQQSVLIDIQGDSGHPHDLELTEALLQKLVSDGQLTLESSIDAGHAHKVTLSVIE